MNICSGCLNKEIDVQITIDHSESVHISAVNMEYLRNFVIDIVNGSDVDSGNVRFAVSVYTHEVHNIFHLNTFTTRAEMINAIQTMPMYSGGTNTTMALANLGTVFTNTNGHRTGVPKVYGLL